MLFSGGRGWIRTTEAEKQQIYSLPPLATRELSHIYLQVGGAGGRTRTPDLLITNQLLYQLSYTSIATDCIITRQGRFVNKKINIFIGADRTTIGTDRNYSTPSSARTSLSF